MKKIKIISLSFLALILGFNIQAQELPDIVNEVSEAIELDETQTKALENQMGKYAISLQLIFDKYEEAEPDPQAMLTDIKHAREEYHKALKSDIGKEKFKAYEGFVDKVQLEILAEAAGLRLLDIKDPIKMTDEQLVQLKPVMAKLMKSIMSTLMEYIDKPLNVRNKLKISNSLKSAKKTFEADRAKILTGEQIKKWDELIAAAKEESK